MEVIKMTNYEKNITHVCDYIGSMIFSNTHILPPKTKKDKAESKIKLETMLSIAQILLNNDNLTNDNLIDIAINRGDFRDYMKGGYKYANN
jgi:hypothetical protein